MFGWLRTLQFIAAATLLCGTAFAAGTLDTWRAEAARTRTLAENDAPRARQQAQRLQATLPTDAAPADRALALNLLARAEIYMALTDDAAQHAQQALQLATQHGDRIGQVEADLNIALNSVNQGRIDQLKSVTEHSLAALQGVDRPELLVEALLRTSMTYRRVGQFDESVTMAMQAMEIAKRSRNALALTYAHQAMAISFGQSDRQKEANEHNLQMREQARAANSRMLEAFALVNLGYGAGLSGDFRSAEARIHEGLGLFRAVGAPFGVNHALFALADQFRFQRRYPEAVKVLDEVVANYRRYPNNIGLWYALNARSTNHESLGDRKAAQSDAQWAYELAKAIDISTYRIESAQRLATLAAAAGNHKRAYELGAEATTLTATAAREKASARMLELAQRFETESKQREIDELTRRNQLQTAELRQRELRQRWLFTVLVAAAIALAGSAFFVLHLRRSEAAIRSLNASLEQRVQAATAELRQQTSYLRTLIDTLPMLAWLKDTRGRYLAVNQAMADACGRPPAEIVGRDDADVCPGELDQASRAGDVDAMTRRERRTYEAALPGPAAPQWMEVYKAPVLDEDGTVLGIVGVARDISERKAAEAAREAALAEAERLAQQRSEFLAQMSHELRTPLNGILGFAHILQRDKSLTERQERGLKIIQESGQHLLTLITDLLDLARIDAAKLELYPTHLSLPVFLAVVADIVRVKAEEKGLLFVEEFAEDLPFVVRADEKRLRQVLLNLLSNAVKFTDRGEVRLRVTAARRGAATTVLRFEVQDTGIGMNGAQLARLFQPFEQVGEASRREGGTGLGLAISRELVRLMGGDIHVHSVAGQGSEFWFEVELPVLEGRLAQAPRQGAPVGYEGPRRKVLVADDVPQNRAVLIDSLNVLGFDLIEAADGQAALTCAQSLRPDLIVMDVTMPVLGGIEATRRIHSRQPQLPIVMLTMHGEQALRHEAIEAGASAFLTKDCSMQEVVDTVVKTAGGDVAFSTGIAAAILQELGGNDRGERAERTESPLTPREEEILQLIADGCSTTEVADHLYISQKTVKNHLASIYAKLDARDRTQAVLNAVRIGIVRLT